ncbi:glyceraldehyde-3-phosphate dehydrogenase [Cognatishimia sp. F0-27]|uniref:glyceraldehyde-3-phosphate dehydrogenase n=1 Tax=Cognatishimia sp. F0-27 TaxID=2816855 RepID=UPI001D0BF753|nr:glyceraldehyde-3-phosphate dehydrogenase [Cognatishimia sp. F0-27]MCC1493358.1 glyceraldehyde-3-phosphate dehydrogenase [Cognatishimia sp. F0-27]
MSFQTIRKTFAQRTAYRSTLEELRSLPMSTRIDLDIAGREEQVARRAVYG